ncbi:MAG: hypothetical protein LUG85_05505 [Clostridiales bacterium]|nr:hypothetical protein [Clostridiales bacterium]
MGGFVTDTYTNIINGKPKNVGGIPSGLITGNGDLAVICDDDNSDFLLHIAKCDFWKLPSDSEKGVEDGGIKSVGTVRIGNLDLSIFSAVFDMKNGLLNFTIGNAKINIFTAVENKVYIEISAPLKEKFPSMSVEMSKESGSSNFTCSDDGISWYMRKFDGRGVAAETAAALCCRRFSSVLTANEKIVRFVISVVTGFETKSYTAKAIEMSVNGDFEKDKKRTADFWRRFFAASDINIPDKDTERQYHASLYLLRCCMGNNDFPPGAYGNFITDGNAPNCGCYCLDGSFEAPFYGVFASNHPEMAKSYMSPIAEYVAKCKDISLPAKIMPKGLRLYTEKELTSKELYSLFAAVVPIMMWYSTYDRNYARTSLYPFLSLLGEYWERQAKKGSINPYIVGYIKMLFDCLTDMETVLNVDTDKIPHQREILDNLGDYPTAVYKGRRCFDFSAEEMSKEKCKSLALSPIFPASAEGVSSENKIFKTARNTYFLKGRRLDEFAYISLPCGARVGEDPDTLMNELKKYIDKYSMPNMLFNLKNGCIEHLGTVICTVNEMLMQSYDGIIRIFPAWNNDKSSSFQNLRARGAFLVSASLSGGKVKSFTIKSLAGNICKVRIPENVRINLRTEKGQKIKYKKKDGYIEFTTIPDCVYSIL